SSRLLWLSGFALSVVSNLGSGFCTDRIPFNIWRPSAGVGVAASFVPNRPLGAQNTLVLAAQNAPALLAGVIAALLAPYDVQNVAGRNIFFVSMISFGLGNLLGALAPANVTYWTVTFFELSPRGRRSRFELHQHHLPLIVTNSVDAAFQGIACGIVTTVMYYSSVSS
ncbi:hypothetical protein JCM24511_02042, partial [Saitozyma sp. JCM 24511]